MIESDPYLRKGVSSGKTNLKNLTKNLEPGICSDTFCNILPDLLGNSCDHGVLIHSDGVGTKAVLAYLYWKETGDLSVFEKLAIDALVMNLDDMACVGAVDHFVLTNTICRNRFLIPDDVIKKIIDGYQGFMEQISSYGITLKMGGGETADMGDSVRTLTLDACSTARIGLAKVIDFKSLKPGTVIVGLSSFGQCSWEDEYNSGIGCNGLTMARHDSLSEYYARKYPEAFSPEMPSETAYSGGYKLTKSIPNSPLNLGKLLLSPTRTYLPIIKKVLTELPKEVRGIVHCTGGGQTKCMKFGKEIHYVKNNLFSIPPLFSFLLNTKSYSLKEMFPVYNMGHRMELFVDEKYASIVIDIAKSFQVNAQIIGYCDHSDIGRNQLTIEAAGEKIKY